MSPRTSALLTLILIAAGCGHARPATSTKSRVVDGAEWKLLWHDEFDGDALDAGKWKIGLPWRGSDGEGRHHDDRYASYIMDHNVVVEGGVLKLLTRREDAKDAKGRTFHFTQGLITSAHSFRHRYGYWEARVKIPVEAGPGLWPAFWTLAEGWPPEMDICEVWTSTNRNHQGMAYRPPQGGRERWDDVDRRDVPLPGRWNTFGMEWGPGYQIYNVNGRVTKRVYGDHVTDAEHYILLNSGVESERPPTFWTRFPNAFEVDYVRVYERPDAPAFHNGGFEDGDAPWKLSGQAVRVGYGKRIGKYALRVDHGGAAEQKVYGLRPGTTYALTGWVNTLAGRAELTADGHVATQRKDDGRRRVEFTTAGDATSAMVRCTAPVETSVALFDDIEVRALPDPSRRDR